MKLSALVLNPNFSYCKKRVQRILLIRMIQMHIMLQTTNSLVMWIGNHYQISGLYSLAG